MDESRNNHDDRLSSIKVIYDIDLVTHSYGPIDLFQVSSSIMPPYRSRRTVYEVLISRIHWLRFLPDWDHDICLRSGSWSDFLTDFWACPAQNANRVDVAFFELNKTLSISLCLSNMAFPMKIDIFPWLRDFHGFKINNLKELKNSFLKEVLKIYKDC